MSFESEEIVAKRLSKFFSEENGIPEAEWITNQFLEGIHPWASQDPQSPDEKMQDFFDTELNNLVMNYMQQHLLSNIRTYF